MNGKSILFFTIILVECLAACNPDKRKEEKEKVFTKEDFAENKALRNPEEIVLNDVLNPALAVVVKDSLLLVNNQPGSEYFLEIYSLNTLSPIVQLVRRGNGPDEMTACVLVAHTERNPFFYLQDTSTKTYYKINLDSTVQYRSLCIVSKFRYSSRIAQHAGICMVDARHYIGYNRWYLEDEEYGNGLDSSLDIYSVEYGQNEQEEKESFPYFVEPVNGALSFVNPETGQIWSLDMHRDRISVYDDSLRLARVFVGPDNFRPEYAIRKMPTPVKFVGFANGLEYRAYTDYFLTDKHVYLVYEGEEHFDLENMTPVEVFKLDFQGNLLCRYEVDRHIYSISLDSNEEYLYGMAKNSVMEEAVIVRYKL